MRLVPSLLATLAAFAPAAFAAQSIFMTTADLVVAGAGYLLPIRQYNPEENTEGFVAVLENGVLIPGCESLKRWEILVDFESGAQSLVACNLPPSSTPGWRTIDVYAPATSTSPATSATLRLYTTAQPMPTMMQVSTFAPSTTLTAVAGFSLYAPAIPVYPNEPDLTTLVRRNDLPGTITATLDGRSCGGYCSVYPVAGGRHPVSGTYHGAPSYLDAYASGYVVTIDPSEDFNGDGKADILWQNTAGRIAIWFMDGARQVGAGDLFPAGSGWTIPLVGNIAGKAKYVAVDSAGVPAVGGVYKGPYVAAAPKLANHYFGDTSYIDIVYENGTGVWSQNYPTFGGPPPKFQLAGSGWHARLTADFDGNGLADVVLQHDDGSVDMVVAAYNNGLYVGARAHLIPAGTAWVPSFTARFDYDSLNDILWTHPDGRTAIWIMAGTSQIGGGVILPAGTGFKPIWVADLNGDGRADIVWERASDGRTAFWLMDGIAQIGAAEIFPANSGWKLLRMADFNGDGFPDYLAQHTDGRVAMGIFDGVRTFTQTQLLPAGTGFSPIVTPH